MWTIIFLSSSHYILVVSITKLVFWSDTTYFPISIPILLCFPLATACCAPISITIPLQPLYDSMSPFSLRPFFLHPPSCHGEPMGLAVASHPVWPRAGFCYWYQAAGLPLSLHPLHTPLSRGHRVSCITKEKLSDAQFSHSRGNGKATHGLLSWTPWLEF